MTSVSPPERPPLAARPESAAGNGQLAWTLGFLTLISTFNYLDRSLIGLLLPLIKADLQLSDTALGLISGLAFALIYSVLSLPIANLADRHNRRNIVAIGFAFWSFMTAMSGYAANGIQMAFCRFLMGAGEAAGLAPSQSMIADRVGRDRRPFALAIFSTAAAVDSLILLPLSAWIAGQYGWRAAFQVAGVAGLVLAPLFYLTVREPKRQSADLPSDRRTVSLLEAFLILWRSHAFKALLAGGSFMGAALYATGTWTTALLTRVHGLSVTEVGLYIMPVRGVIGIVGIVAVGWLSDRLGRRDDRWRYWVPAIVSLILAPAYAAFLLSDTTAVWITGMLVTSVLYSAYQGPVFAATIALSPEHMKTVAVAIKVFVTGIFGQIFGPLTIGALNDLLTPYYGDHAIRYSMMATAVCCVLGGLCFLWAGRLASQR